MDLWLLGIIVFIESFDKHYYDEDNINIGNPIDCKVVVNHVVQLTAEEKKQARQDAIQRVQDETYRNMTQQPKKKAKTVALNPQPTLFDF